LLKSEQNQSKSCWKCCKRIKQCSRWEWKYEEKNQILYWKGQIGKEKRVIEKIKWKNNQYLGPYMWMCNHLVDGTLKVPR